MIENRFLDTSVDHISFVDPEAQRLSFRLSLQPGEEYFTSNPGPGWQFVREGPHGGHVYRAVGKEASQEQNDKKDHTDSPAFKAWFAESKVADESGKPLVAYHGSTKDFGAFDPDKGLTVTDKIGSWFAMDPKFAEARLRHRNVGIAGEASQGKLPEGSVIMPTYLSIKKPLELANRNELDTFLDQNIIMPDKLIETYKPAIIARWKDNADPDDPADQKKLADRIASFDRYHTDPKARQLINNLAHNTAENAGKEEPFVHLARAALHDYDGVHIADDKGHGEAWVSLKPTQIKSIHNSGAFDASQADIRLSLAPGEEYFTSPPGPGWQFVRQGKHGGHIYRPVERQQAAQPATAQTGKSSLLARAAKAAASAGKAIGEKVKAALTPANILKKFADAGHAIAHPSATIAAKLDSLYQRYGASGATAIAGAYAAYYTVAAMNPILFTIPVPLTATVLGSARVLRYGILKARGRDVQFSLEEDGGDMLADAKAFIASIAAEEGEDPPEIDDDILAQVMASLMENGESEPEQLSISLGFPIKNASGPGWHDSESGHPVPAPGHAQAAQELASKHQFPPLSELTAHIPDVGTKTPIEQEKDPAIVAARARHDKVQQAQSRALVADTIRRNLMPRHPLPRNARAAIEEFIGDVGDVNVLTHEMYRDAHEQVGSSHPQGEEMIEAARQQAEERVKESLNHARAMIARLPDGKRQKAEARLQREIERSDPVQLSTLRLALQPGEAYFNSPPRDAENWTFVRNGKHGGHIYRRVGEASAEPGVPPKITPAQKATAFSAIKQLAGKENLTDLVHVRKALASQGIVERAAQDAVIHELRQDNRIEATNYEGRHGLTPEQKEAGIKEGDNLKGYLLIRMGFEDPVESLRARVRRLARKRYPAIQMSNEAAWEAYTGGRGGKGWRSLRTGRVVYQEGMPGEGEHGGESEKSVVSPDDKITGKVATMKKQTKKTRNAAFVQEMQERISKHPPRHIRPLNLTGHNAVSKEHLDELTDRMKVSGWVGRPLLGARDEDGELQALTGSHRLSAADAAGLSEVPIIELDSEELLTAAKEAGFDGIHSMEDFAKKIEDEDKVAVMKRLRDPLVDELMRRENSDEPDFDVQLVEPPEADSDEEEPDLKSDVPKEKWQMTSDEFMDKTGASRLAHYGHVKDALEAGKPVPPEVLAGFPDLAEKHKRAGQ